MMDSPRVGSQLSGLEASAESTLYYAVRLACPESVLENQDCATLVCRVEKYGDIHGCSYQDGFVTALIENKGESLIETENGSVPSELEMEIIGADGTVIQKGTAIVEVSNENADPSATDDAALANANVFIRQRERMKKRYGALYPFVIIAITYLLFTITDGAVRMIVLLHAYQNNFSALDVAIMFSFYEAAGVLTNLAAGLLGAKWGIKTTLVSGLSMQLVAFAMLFAWQNDWSKISAIVYVTVSQVLSGVAKDLTKLGGKTVTKLVTPEGKNSSLFKLVSFITGWKNSLKGVGYFLGAATVSVSYYLALGILVGLILLAYPFAVFGLSNDLGRARKENVQFSQLFKNKYNINVLSLSRVFLFGSRDLWFEVPLPFFLRDPQSGIGWSRTLTGAFLAIFIIVYGQVQSWTPQLALKPLRQAPPDKFVAFWWCTTLSVPTAILGGLLLGTDIFGFGVPSTPPIVSLTVLLYAFCIFFAINSAIHSYLIVRYGDGDKIAVQVGVYYASNALGRLFGTLLSGILYTYVGSTVVDGFGACVLASCGVSLISSVVDMFLREDQANASFFGPFNRCLGGYQPLEAESEQGKIEKIDTVDSMQNAPSVQECEKSTDLPADTPTCQDMQNKV